MIRLLPTGLALSKPVLALILSLLISSQVQWMVSYADSTNATDLGSYLTNETHSADRTNNTNTLMPVGKWERIIDLPRSINDLAVDRDNPRVIYAAAGKQGSGSGVYKSEDYGLTWNLSSSGLPDEDVTAIAIDHQDSRTVYASVGIRGDIFASEDEGKSWELRGNTGAFGGFSNRLYVDPKDDNSLFLVTVPGGLIKSYNNGRSWQHIEEGLPHDEDARIGAYVLSLAIDPKDSKVIYAGTGGFVGQGHGVYKSLDGGLTWNPANRGMLDYRIEALAVDPAYPQTIYAGSEKGEIFKSTDAGKTWNDIENRNMLEEFSQPSVRSIIIESAHPNTVYLLLNYAGIVTSNDGGENWSVLGKPERLESPMFTAMATSFDPKPIIIVGVNPDIDNAGGWRYAA
jgi:photosystem II stability/assembly factor-like uncharacterized protein